MFRELIAHVSLADGIALVIFVVGWFGYYADYAVKDAHFIGFTIIVPLVLWRREFHSHTLRVLAD